MRISTSLTVCILAGLLASAELRAQSNLATLPMATRVTAADLAQLRWIEGDWSGTAIAGQAEDSFFKRYRFVNATTLLVESFADSTFGAPTDSARYELRFGRFGNTGRGQRWAASRMDSLGVAFAPVARTRSRVSWTRTAGTEMPSQSWESSIRFTDPAGTPQEWRYRMQRVR